MSDAAQIIAAHAKGITWSRWLAETEEDELNQMGEEVIRCTCECGAEMDESDHPAHVLAVLSETHAVVELPEGEIENRVVSWEWGTTAQPAVVTEPFSHVALAPNEAREYGAELIAAARVADRSPR